MTPPSASNATDRQTVGDILLARGYVSEEQLEQAIASQQRSGKPLGQVLVEAGAITRLELASALAEQWSDTASWLGPPEASKGGRESKRARDAFLDDVFSEGRQAAYAEQLQNAVVELARRVAAFEPSLTDLKLRIEAAEAGGPEGMFDRIEVVQDAVTALARRLDELTEGLERAFTSVERSSGELTAELDALSSKVELGADRAAVDQLRTTVDELAGRPTGDPILTAQVETLADRLEEMRDESGRRTDELRGRVEELASRPQTDPALAEQVEHVASRLDGMATSESLAPVQAAVDALRIHVEELAGRPQADPGLAAQLDELTTRIEALAGTDALEAVRAAVEEMAGRPAGDPELTGRVDALAAQIDELAGRPQADPALAAQLDELTTRIEALAGTDALEAVRAAVEEMAGRPAADPALAARLDELAARLGEVADAGRAGDAELARLREELEAMQPVADGEDVERRVDHVVGRLDALHARVEEVAALSDDDNGPDIAESLRAELAARIGEVTSRTEGLAQETAGAVGAWVSERAGLEARLDALAAEVAEARFQATSALPGAAPPVPATRGKARTDASEPAEPTGVEGELERLRMAVERINMHLGERERAIAELMRSRSSEIKLEELAERLAELEQGTPAAASGTSNVPAGDGDLHVELRELAHRLEEGEKAAKTDRDKVLTQLERMASSIDWRFRRLESGEDEAA